MLHSELARNGPSASLAGPYLTPCIEFITAKQGKTAEVWNNQALKCLQLSPSIGVEEPGLRGSRPLWSRLQARVYEMRLSEGDITLSNCPICWLGWSPGAPRTGDQRNLTPKSLWSPRAMASLAAATVPTAQGTHLTVGP